MLHIASTWTSKALLIIGITALQSFGIKISKVNNGATTVSNSRIVWRQKPFIPCPCIFLRSKFQTIVVIGRTRFVPITNHIGDIPRIPSSCIGYFAITFNVFTNTGTSIVSYRSTIPPRSNSSNINGICFVIIVTIQTI